MATFLISHSIRIIILVSILLRFISITYIEARSKSYPESSSLIQLQIAIKSFNLLIKRVMTFTKLTECCNFY